MAGHDYDEKHSELRDAVDAFARDRGLRVKRGPRSIWWLAAALLIGCGGDDATTSANGAPSDPGSTSASSSGSGSSSTSSGGGGNVDASTGNDAATSGSCNGKTGTAGDKTITIKSGGIDRTYNLHVPTKYDASKPTPLVMLWHGYTQSAKGITDATHFPAASDARGFILVVPEGTGGQKSFNAGACCGTAPQQKIDDVQLAKDLLAKTAADYCVDTKRVFTTGFSNGGMLAYRFACELSGMFAAAASVAGTISIDPDSCKPTRAIPMMHIHGTNDLIVSYTGGGIGGNESVATSVSTLRTADACPAGDGMQVYQKGDITCTEWGPCNTGSHVRHCKVDGGGHQWPGGETLPYGGSASPNLDATNAIVDFFDAHPMP